MADTFSRTHYLMPIIMAAVAAVSFQGTRGLYETTESRYAECSREMLETGDWLVPRLDYGPHWTKPPMSYWAIAGGMAVVGVNEWGARLAAAVAFVFTVWVIAELGAVLWDRRTGWLAGLTYATAPFTVGAANTVNADTLLTLWMLLVVFAYWKARQAAAAGAPPRCWVLLMWGAAGLGFLTKGPPSLLALLVVAVICLVDRRRSVALPRVLTLQGILTFLIVGFGWYASMAIIHPGLLAYWLTAELWGRVGADEFGRNTEWYKPFVVYLPPLVFGLGLWMAVAALGVYRRWKTVRQAGALAGLRDSPGARFLMVWILAPLAILSISRNRLPLYVLPLLPAVALVVARSLVLCWAAPRLRRIAAVAAVLSLALVVVGKAAIAYLPSRKDERLLYCAVRREAGPGPRVLNCTNRELYGLMFYFRGHVEQADLNRAVEETVWTAGGSTSDAADQSDGLCCAVVTRRKDFRLLQALDERGILHERVVTRQGAITVVYGTRSATDVAVGGTTAE